MLKKYLLLLIITVFSMQAWAQVSAYTFAQSTGIYTSITGGTQLAIATSASSLDDVVYGPITIPSFTFNGTPYTTIFVSTNGFMSFGTTMVASTDQAISILTGQQVVCPWARDINGFFNIGGRTSEIRWETVGSEVVIQWRDFRPAYSTSTTLAYGQSFQVRLNTSTNVVRIIYSGGSYAAGSTAISGATTTAAPQVGLRGTATTDFNNRTNNNTVAFTSSTAGTVNTANQFFNTNTNPPGMPSAGLTYTWTPPPPPACVVPSVTLTPTSSSAADVSWTCASCTGTYIVEYGAAGFTPGTGAAAGTGGTVISGATSPTSLTGLSSSATTDVFVRQNCGGSGFSTNSTVRKFIPGDVCGNAIDLGGLTSPISSTTVGASSNFSYACSANSDPDLIYFIDVPANYTLVIGQTVNGYDSENYLHYGGACPGTTQVACFDDPDIQNITWLNNTGSTQRLYWVQDGFGTTGNAGTFTLAWTLTAPPLCPNVTVGTTSGITSAAATLNWTSSAPATDYQIEYGVSPYTFTGTPTIATTSGATTQPLSSLSATTTYQFRIRSICPGPAFGNWTTTSSFTTLATPPANDNCSNAITLGAACAGSPVSGTTLNSTVDAIYTNCGAGGTNLTQRGVWYRYVGDNNNVTINTCNATGYDSRLTVYSGSCGAFTCVTANDDMGASCGVSTLRSSVSFDAFAGTDYYIFIHGYSLDPALSTTGNFVLSLTCSPLCTPQITNGTCGAATSLVVPTSCTKLSLNNNCAPNAITAPSGSPSAFGSYPNLWYSFVAPSDQVIFKDSLSGTATNVGIVVYNAVCGGTVLGQVYPMASGQNYALTGLTIGNTYFVQLYTPFANRGSFEFCISYDPCPTPITLTATGITSTTANLGWTSAGTLFDVEMGISPFTPTGTPTHTGVANPFNTTGLSPTTAYTYYVRRDCGAGVYSAWNGPFTFTTLATPPANDNCATAVSIDPDFTCTGAASVNGSIQGASNSGVAATTGTADDDVWFSFVAENTTQILTLTKPNSTDFVTQIFSGSCGSLTSLGSYDADPNNLSVSGLTIGNTYYIRVYSWSNGTIFTNPNAQFSLCVQNPPPPPANDNCAGAIAFPAIPTTGDCANVTVNTAGATGVADATCTGTEDDDVWYTFTVPAGNTTVNYSTTNITGSTDRAFQVYNACAGTSIFCSGNESGTITGLTGGVTYILRTYTWSSGVSSNFSLCLSVTPPPPANDNCAGAKPLQICSAPDTTRNLGGATQSLPAVSCGGFTGTADDDVWYSFVAPSPNVVITLFSTYDGVIELRSGSCNGTYVDCGDNSSSNSFEDILTTTLTTGATYYIRVYSYGATRPSASDYIVLNVAEPGCWLGTNNANWNNAGNWSDFTVPNSCAANVTIPAGTPFPPSITSATYTVGNVNIASGVNLALTGNNLNVCGNWAAGTGANAVTVGSGNVVLQGTAAQTISGNTNFERLTVNATRSYTNNGTVTISQRYTPQAGSLNNAGTMTFLSTSPSDIATIDLNPANTGSLTGNITAQRFIPIGGSNQHYVSSPLNSLPLSQFGASGGSGNVVPTANCDETQLAVGSLYGTVFRYNEANGSACSLAGWEVVSSGSAENARGYSAYLTGAGTPLSVNGVANMGSTYTKTGNTNSNWTNTTLQGRSQNSGWALVGNPYLSTINLSDKTGAGFDNQAQVWQTSGPYTGTYQPVVMGSGSAFVAPFQGFMVRKTAVGGTADFTVGRSECVNNTSTFYKTSSNGTVSIVVHGNGFADVTKVVFDENSTNQFDNTMDANKLPGRLAQPMLASKLGSDLYSINNLNSIATNPTVPLEFMPGTNGSYTFTFDDISTFDPTVMVYLEDKMSQNGWYDLRARNVQTFACSTTDRKDRFVLHFTAPVQSDSKDADCDDLGTIALEEITTNNWNVTISNTQGAIVHTQVLDKNNPVNVKNLVPGTYDITFTTKSGYVATRQITISGVQPLVANISASTLTPNVNQSVQFNSSLNTAATVSWDFGDGNTSAIENPTHIYAAEGIYKVVLIAVSNDGCTNSTTQNVNVRSVATGIENNSNSQEVIVNNIGNNVVVSFKGYTNENASIIISNVLGQVLFTGNHNVSSTFNYTLQDVDTQVLIIKTTIDGKSIKNLLALTSK